ncbi:MAG: hypothetical protein LBJ10_04020 [Clostridiales bacterium]|nr:hypothetical protein [Clostridiales bacterium]
MRKWIGQGWAAAMAAALLLFGIFPLSANAADIPPGDVMEVRFDGGAISDAAGRHSFSGSGSGIAYDDELGRYAAKFTGSSSAVWYTAVTDSDYSLINNGVALEIVFMADAGLSDGGEKTIVGNMSNAGTGISMYPHEESFDLDLWVHLNGGYKVPRVNGLSYGEWYHAVGVYDGSAVILYLNGAEVDRVSGVSGNIATPSAGILGFNSSRFYVIGADTGSGTINSLGIERPYTGRLASFGIHSEPMSAETVAERAAALLPAGGSDPEPPDDPEPPKAPLAISVGAQESSIAAGGTAAFAISAEELDGVSCVELTFEISGDALDLDTAAIGDGSLFTAVSPAGGPIRWTAQGGVSRGKVMLVYPGEAGAVFAGKTEIARIEFATETPGPGAGTLTLTGVVASEVGEVVYDGDNNPISASFGKIIDSEIDGERSSASVTTVKPRIKWDFNDDGAVEYYDLAYAAQFHGVAEGSALWQYAEIADVNGDGIVGQADLAEILAHFTV